MIEDISTTQIQFVDSLEKIWSIQKDLYRGPALDQKQQEFIDTMLKWPSLGQLKREKAYSDFCSHEFNTFLKLKDPEFFETTVRPFLMNKVEKTLVDYWLLDNPDDALSRFLEPHSKN